MLHWLRPVAAFVVLDATVALGACAVAPTDPISVIALPAKGESLQNFSAQDASCRVYAAGSIGDNRLAQTATNGAVSGPAAGSETGLAGATTISADAGAVRAAEPQQRYDIAYTQCMYTHGNTVEAAPSTYAYDYPSYAYPDEYFYGPGFWPDFAIGIGPRHVRFHHFHHFAHFQHFGHFGHR